MFSGFLRDVDLSSEDFKRLHTNTRATGRARINEHDDINVSITDGSVCGIDNSIH